MPDWMHKIVSDIGRVAQGAGGNPAAKRRRALRAEKKRQRREGMSGVASALGDIASQAASPDGSERIARQRALEVEDLTPGGAYVILDRDHAQQPTRLRIVSTVKVYSDVVGRDLLERKVAKMQAQINNYWNNEIPPSRILTLTSSGGTLGFAYDGLDALTVPATGNAIADAQALAATWAASAAYDAIGNAMANVNGPAGQNGNGTVTITFIDNAARAFSDRSAGGSSIVEVTAPLPTGAVPIGTRFTVERRSTWRPGDAFGRAPEPEPLPRIPVNFEIRVEPYYFPAGIDSNAQRQDEMNRMRLEATRWRTTLVWIHLNTNTNTNIMTSWASGGLGSWRVGSWPGEYAHEFGHILGHFTGVVSSNFASGSEHGPAGPTLMSGAGSKAHRRATEGEVNELNFWTGLGWPTRFPGSVLEQDMVYDAQKIGHRISAQTSPRNFVRDQVIYLDMSNFATAKPDWRFDD